MFLKKIFFSIILFSINVYYAKCTNDNEHPQLDLELKLSQPGLSSFSPERDIVTGDNISPTTTHANETIQPQPTQRKRGGSSEVNKQAEKRRKKNLTPQQLERKRLTVKDRYLRIKAKPEDLESFKKRRRLHSQNYYHGIFADEEKLKKLRARQKKYRDKVKAKKNKPSQ